MASTAWTRVSGKLMGKKVGTGETTNRWRCTCCMEREVGESNYQPTLRSFTRLCSSVQVDDDFARQRFDRAEMAIECENKVITFDL